MVSTTCSEADFAIAKRFRATVSDWRMARTMGGVLSRLRYLEPGFLRDRAAGFARPGRASH